MALHWWSDDPAEIYYMEITRRPDIGSDLRAPTSARGGVDTSGYRLVDSVRAGDIVVHYDGGAEAIVGVSRATGERYSEPIWWAARGSYARRAGVEEQWLPGLHVVLEAYTPLADRLHASVIRSRSQAILSLRERLQRDHPGHPLYFPWNQYQDTLRTFQTYLAKFPRDALELLPEVAAAVTEMRGAQGVPAPPASEIEEFDRGIAAAAGRPRPVRHGSGQGFATDQAAKVAVEAHAMNAALAYYSKLGTVTDVSRTASYDYVVSIDDVPWHVEVKGTTSDGQQVLLTPNEVEHAQTCPHVALFVLSGVSVSRTESGDAIASGGVPSIQHGWKLEPSRLVAVGYRYTVEARESPAARVNTHTFPPGSLGG